MAPADPTISLYLDGELSFQLHRKGFAGTTATIKIQMHDTSNSATLVIPGYQASTKSFSLPLALQGGMFDIIDAETDSKLPIPSSDGQPDELPVRAGAPNQWFDLKVDASDDFWTQLLFPGHKYEVRWADSNQVLRAYSGEAKQNSLVPVSIRLLPRPIKITVFDDATAPPQLDLSLSPTSKVCHLSGEPRFGFEFKVTSHADEVITVCLHKTPLKELHGLEEIVKVEDHEGEEVEWPYGIGCFDGPEAFPSDDNFEELEPEVAYERTFWLEKFDKESSNGGELEELQAGTRYKGEISRTLLRSFTKWRKGSKRELLAGDEKEKEDRWKGGSRQVILEVSDPFAFETVS